MRDDPSAGVREVAAYIGPGQRLLGVTYTPLDASPRGGVVICSSLHAEFLANYRKEVLLARRLASAGFAVQRFHYRGEGNSLGSPDEVTLTGLRQDVVAASERLRECSGLDQVAVVATRLGALVAAEESSGPIVLWEPVLEARHYFREAFRARRMRELKDGMAVPSSAKVLEDQLEQDGSTDVLGYTIHRSLFRSLASQRLALGEPARSVLLVQIAKASELRKEYSAAADSWRSAGHTVETAVVSEDESWWFVGEDWQPEERRPQTTTLMGTTLDWLEGQRNGAAA